MCSKVPWQRYGHKKKWAVLNYLIWPTDWWWLRWWRRRQDDDDDDKDDDDVAIDDEDEDEDDDNDDDATVDDDDNDNDDDDVNATGGDEDDDDVDDDDVDHLYALPTLQSSDADRCQGDQEWFQQWTHVQEQSEYALQHHVSESICM